MSRENKIVILSLIFLFSVVLIVFFAIYYIWGYKEKDMKNKYTYSGYEEELMQSYSNSVMNYLKTSNFRKLINKIDDSFFEEVGIIKENQDELKQYLLKRRVICDKPVYTGYTVYPNDTTGTYVYKLNFRSNGFERFVYVIETKPYEYTLSFAENTIPGVTSEGKNVVVDNIFFDVAKIENTEDHIKYKVKITNKNEYPIEFDFSNVSNTVLLLNDNTSVPIAASVLDTSGYVINSNSYYTTEFFFNIDTSNQSKITGMRFLNVKVNGENKKITINI